MPAPIQFFDMETSITPPTGHFQPVPLTLGANWQPNDVRILFISAEAQGQDSITTPVPMVPDPPTGFTAAYSIDPGFESRGVYYRYLQKGDADAYISFPKPPGWREFMFATVTARGVNPAVAPIAGLTTVAATAGDTACVVSSVTVPAAGTMALFVGTVPDPGGGWPSWATSTGVPTGWTPLVATDKSGVTYFPYDANAGVNLVGKSYSTAGTTGTVSFPMTKGSPAFAGLYLFLRPAPDVAVAVGAV